MDIYSSIVGAFYIFNMFLLLVVLGVSTYGFILFVKLAKRGIKALDIYIEKNKNKVE